MTDDSFIVGSMPRPWRARYHHTVHRYQFSMPSDEEDEAVRENDPICRMTETANHDFVLFARDNIRTPLMNHSRTAWAFSCSVRNFFLDRICITSRLTEGDQYDENSVDKEKEKDWENYNPDFEMLLENGLIMGTAFSQDDRFILSNVRPIPSKADRAKFKEKKLRKKLADRVAALSGGDVDRQAEGLQKKFEEKIRRQNERREKEGEGDADDWETPNENHSGMPPPPPAFYAFLLFYFLRIFGRPL